MTRTEIEMADIEHSRNDIWNRLAAQNEQITDIARSQAGTDARLVALESAVDHGFKSLSQDLTRIADRVNQPTPPPNYLALVMLALGVLAAFGGYSLLITGPIEAQAQRNERIIYNIQQEHAGVEYLRGKIDALEQQVRDIDNQGSRRWNHDPSKDDG